MLCRRLQASAHDHRIVSDYDDNNNNYNYNYTLPQYIICNTWRESLLLPRSSLVSWIHLVLCLLIIGVASSASPSVCLSRFLYCQVFSPFNVREWAIEFYRQMTQNMQQIRTIRRKRKVNSCQFHTILPVIWSGLKIPDLQPAGLKHGSAQNSVTSLSPYPTNLYSRLSMLLTYEFIHVHVNRGKYNELTIMLPDIRRIAY